MTSKTVKELKNVCLAKVT